MDKALSVESANKSLADSGLAYIPYANIAGKNFCRSCGTEASDETLSNPKIKTVNDHTGHPTNVHVCPNCKYSSGSNVYLKKRISELRKKLGLHEFPTGDKFRNNYLYPTTEGYMFIEPSEGIAVKLTEDALINAINELETGKPPAEQQIEDKKTEEVEQPLNETTSEISQETQDPPVIVEIEEDPADEIITDENSTIIEAINDFANEGIDGTIDSDTDDFSDIIITDSVNETSIEDVIVEEVDTEDLPEDVIFEEIPTEIVEEEFVDKDEYFGDEDEDFTEVFGNASVRPKATVDKTEELSSEDDFLGGSFDDAFFEGVGKPEIVQESNESATNAKTTHSAGVGDVKTEVDPMIQQMLKNNVEDHEDDVFRLDKRGNTGIAQIVHRSRVNDLHENFAESNAKHVIDRIKSLFKKRAQRDIKYELTIDDRTHECPVIDFEGNIRLIFVDLDLDSGRYDIQREVNNKLRTPFSEDSEYDLMTFMVFSDAIDNGKFINRVVKAVAKHIAFNLKITKVFAPISVLEDSDGFFYTNNLLDQEVITRFDSENCAGNVNKPFNGEIAAISRWNNPSLDENWRYRKEIQNRSVIMNGGTVDYDDLSMFMVASMKYIMILPKSANNPVMNVTIVDYTESLDLFVRDGFGALVGMLVHSMKAQYPQFKIHLYYERDISMIPSPTLSRYVKRDVIRPLIINEDVIQLNKIAAITANQNGAKVNPIPTEGEPFDSMEYQSPVWKNYVLGVDFRKGPNDNKRMDWRRFTPKSFSKTLGDRLKGYGSVDSLADRKTRESILDKLGFRTVVQPQVIKARVVDEFGVKAFWAIVNSPKFFGIFSINQYMKNSRQVVSDNYMMTGNAPFFNPMYSGQAAQQPNADQNAMFQQMQMNQMMNGGMGMGQMYPNQQYGFGFPQ